MIPEQAIEAAAKVVYGDSLEGVTPEFRAFILDKVRAALEAAAAHMLAGVESVLAQWDAEAIGNQNAATELRKAPRTTTNRSDIARHEQAAVIAKNHATRIRNAIAGNP